MDPDQITSPHVQLFMDTRGADYPVAANHEKGFLSMILKWGKARGYIRIASPCGAVRNLKTKPGGRYVDADDYFAFYEYLLDKGHTAHAVAMEIAYLCGARQQDALRLRRARPARPKGDDCYVDERGLLIAQGKTGKTQLKLWSPRLRAAIELAQTTGIESMWVIHNRDGQRYSRGGFNSTWIRRQRDAATVGIISARFRFHDMKVAAISDYEGPKQYFSGHTTPSQTERYNRRPDEVKPVDGKFDE